MAANSHLLVLLLLQCRLVGGEDLAEQQPADDAETLTTVATPAAGASGSGAKCSPSSSPESESDMLRPRYFAEAAGLANSFRCKENKAEDSADRV